MLIINILLARKDFPMHLPPSSPPPVSELQSVPSSLIHVGPLPSILASHRSFILPVMNFWIVCGSISHCVSSFEYLLSRSYSCLKQSQRWMMKLPVIIQQIRRIIIYTVTKVRAAHENLSSYQRLLGHALKSVGVTGFRCT